MSFVAQMPLFSANCRLLSIAGVERALQSHKTVCVPKLRRLSILSCIDLQQFGPFLGQGLLSSLTEPSEKDVSSSLLWSLEQDLPSLLECLEQDLFSVLLDDLSLLDNLASLKEPREC